MNRLLVLLLVAILCAGCAAGSVATETAVALDVQATLNAEAHSTPTPDAEATEAALVVFVQQTLTAMAPSTPTPDLTATHAAIESHVRATLTAMAPAAATSTVEPTVQTVSAPSSTPVSAPVPASSAGGDPKSCGERFAYVGENGELWTMSLDGTDKTQITNLGEWVFHPQWFPGGDRLLFTTHQNMYVVNVDGTELTRIPYNLDYPAISPDGRKVAGEIDTSERNTDGAVTKIADDLLIVNLDDGYSSTRISYCDEEPCHLAGTSWSPDGQWLAIGGHVTQESLLDIYVMRNDGSEKKRLTSMGSAHLPSWSPDGSQIAFLCSGSTPGPDVRIMNADGSDIRGLSLGSLWVAPARVSWSPDSRRIALSADEGNGPRHIYIFDEEGANPISLGIGHEPAWQPCPDSSAVATATDDFTTVTSIDGASMVYVPAGEFLMGSAESDPDASANQLPQHAVYLDAFWIDRTEVTNAQFARFVAATGHQTDAETGDVGWVCHLDSGIWVDIKGADWQHPHGPDSNLSGLDNHPVVQVSHNDAAAYCQWAGKRLPTEAEWEKAARGTDGRSYPWGNAGVTGNLANLADSNTSFSWGDERIDDGYAHTAPAGAYPGGASPYGALDMAGNVWEWVADWYDAAYYGNSAYENPMGPETGNVRVRRGGAWDDGERSLRSAVRGQISPFFRDDHTGFRCALTP